AIDPDRWYRLSEVAAWLRSTRTGRPPAPGTLNRWVATGRLRAEVRNIRTTTFAVVRGAEVLRLLAELPRGWVAASPEPGAPPAPAGPDSEATRGAMAAVWAEREASPMGTRRRRRVVTRRTRRRRGKATDA